MALAWRPDGKVLAVGFENGTIELFDVESNVPVMINQVSAKITSMRWSSCQQFSNAELTESQEENKDWDFLIQFPSLSKAFSYNPSSQEDVQHCRKLTSESDPSVLLCGTASGHVFFFMSGYMAFGFIDVNTIFRMKCCIRDVILSPNSLSNISILAEDENGDESQNSIHLCMTNFPLISSCYTELCALAERQSILIGTLDYMADTLKQISEGWEGILLEMDNKLHSYAKKMPDQNGMAADFLELLMLGTPSPELDNFLMQELGEKGLKKLGHSIEVSYSNMQRLVLKYLHTVSQAVNFHLADVIGHVRASDKYESVLKFSAESVSKAQRDAAIFWAKGIELQQVIDESMKCFKAFFRWLYVEILRLSDESVSEELSKTSQHDVKFIAEFLSNFSKGVDDDSHTYLERVGQYMKNENLAQPVDRSKNPWFSFLKENPDMKMVPEMLVVDENASLMQAYDRLKESVQQAFSELNNDWTQSCLPHGSLYIRGHPTCRIASMQQIEACSTSDKTFCHILWNNPALDATKCLFLEFDPAEKTVKGLGLTGGSFDNSTFQLVSQSFYTSETLSILVTSIEGHRLIQLPIAPLEHYMSTIQMSPDVVSRIDAESMDMNCMSIFTIAGPVRFSFRYLDKNIE